jgi:hypothetical protein
MFLEFLIGLDDFVLFINHKYWLEDGKGGKAQKLSE